MLKVKDWNRFSSKIQSGPGCWRWKGTHFANGYAAFWLDGQTRLASRISYGAFRGPVRAKHVLHHCDNPGCVNPGHLYLGTHSDNMQDRNRRNRGNPAHGDSHAFAKLTEVKVRDARERHVNGESYAALAREYGVTLGAVRNAVLRITWRSVVDK